MKRSALIFSAILFCLGIVASDSKASEAPYSHNFVIGFSYGNVPFIGHAIALTALTQFSISSDPSLQRRVKPGAYGLLAGTLFYIGETELLKYLSPDSSQWKAYAVATTPFLFAFLKLLLEERLRARLETQRNSRTQ